MKKLLIIALFLFLPLLVGFGFFGFPDPNMMGETTYEAFNVTDNGGEVFRVTDSGGEDFNVKQ